MTFPPETVGGDHLPDATARLGTQTLRHCRCLSPTLSLSLWYNICIGQDNLNPDYATFDKSDDRLNRCLSH